MEDKKEYLRDIAKEHWECGQPFSSDDFRLFQRLCKEDGFDVDGKDWSYYWECYEDCRYNDNVQNYDMEDLTEAAGEKNARRRTWGKDWNNEFGGTGASNIDFFGGYLLDEIRSNLEGLTCTISGKQKTAIDMARTEISIDKDPAPDESVKERKIRGWVYFKSNFNIITEDRQVLKQKVIQAFRGGMADFNDKYKADYLVFKDMVLLSTSFKYGNDNRSMYFVFKVEQEKFHNERPIIGGVYKHTKESYEQGTCPICGEKMWSDDEIVDVLLDGKERSVHGYHCTDESLEKLHDYCDEFWATHDSSGYNYYSAMRQFHPPLCTLIKSTRESLDSNDMFVQNAFPLTIDDNNVVTTKATKPANATYAGSNVGYFWWTEVEKESDASGPEEHTTIYYFETPSDLNKYLKQHPEKEDLVLRRIYENTSKGVFESILHKNASSFNLEDLNELKTAFYNLAEKCEKEDYDYRIKYINVSLVYLDKVCKVAEAPDDVECYHEDDDVVAVFDNISDRHFEDLPEKNYIGVLFDYQAEEANPYYSFMKKLKRNNFINRFCHKYHLTPFYNICCRDRNGGDFLENFEEFVRDNYSVFNIPFEPGIDVVAKDPLFGDEITIFEGRE